MSEPTLNDARVRELRRLEPDWDGYGSVSITDAAVRAAYFLALVPLANGGLQFELHTFTGSAEIEINPLGRISSVSWTAHD